MDLNRRLREWRLSADRWADANGAMASFTVDSSAPGTGTPSDARGKGRLRTAHRTTGTVAMTRRGEQPAEQQPADLA